MTLFVEVRTLSGASYIRAPDVIAVQFVDTQKSTVLMAGRHEPVRRRARQTGDGAHRSRAATNERDAPWPWKPLKSNA